MKLRKIVREETRKKYMGALIQPRLIALEKGLDPDWAWGFRYAGQFLEIDPSRITTDQFIAIIESANTNIYGYVEPGRSMLTISYDPDNAEKYGAKIKKQFFIDNADDICTGYDYDFLVGL